MSARDVRRPGRSYRRRITRRRLTRSAENVFALGAKDRRRPGEAPQFRRASLLVDRPVLHHELNLANRRDVFCWIAVYRDEIGEITRLHLPEHAAHAEHLR